jgi:hypothetical protein
VTAIKLLQQVEEEQGERYYVLPVMRYYRDKRTTISRPQICFVEFRNHLSGDIIISTYAEYLRFKRSQAQGGETILPPSAAEMEYIEMGYSPKRAHTIIGKPV